MNQAARPQEAEPADLADRVGVCLGEPAPRLTRLPGGLSSRRFFRATRASAEPALVMWLPKDAPERRLASELGRTLPFLEVRALLEAHGVRVPALLGALPGEGILVVEDLGETLAERLDRDRAAARELYERAVRDLARAQITLRELPRDSIVLTRSFDRTLLAWELDHFREWGVDALGITLEPSDLVAFEQAKRALVAALAGLAQGFCHRDYQSRNLMALPSGQLAWIDFQDALLGPRAYDLVALLCDSYQNLDEAFSAARLADYGDEAGLSADERNRLRQEFDLITVQRKLKDAGRFIFFERTRADASYLRFVIPTLRRVERALERLEARPELRSLGTLVSRVIEIATSRGMLAP